MDALLSVSGGAVAEAVVPQRGVSAEQRSAANASTAVTGLPGRREPNARMREILTERPAWLPGWVRDELTFNYYMREYGVPAFTDAQVFECLCLELFMAGLSWRTVLTRRDALKEAFAGFQLGELAKWDEEEIARALAHQGIIRNYGKACAVVQNARVFSDMLDNFGVGPAKYLWSFLPAQSPCPPTGDAVPVEITESTEFARCFKKLGGKFLGPKLAFSLFAALGLVDVHASSSPRRGVSGLWESDGSRSSLPLPASVASPLPQALRSS